MAKVSTKRHATVYKTHYGTLETEQHKPNQNKKQCKKKNHQKKKENLT